LKRAKGHPDAPTPVSSPQKKRTHTLADTTINVLPSLLFAPVKQDLSPTYDVFGGNQNTAVASAPPPPSFPFTTPNSLPTSDKRDGTLLSFWKHETAEERNERNQREFEELSRTRESRELDDARAKAMSADRKRIQNKQRQQVHRDALRDIKISNGWKPNQKRVSFSLIIYEGQD
jgi:hypothetical protein